MLSFYFEVKNDSIRAFAVSQSVSTLSFDTRNTDHPRAASIASLRESRSFPCFVLCDTPSISTARFVVGSAKSSEYRRTRVAIRAKAGTPTENSTISDGNDCETTD